MIPMRSIRNVVPLAILVFGSLLAAFSLQRELRSSTERVEQERSRLLASLGSNLSSNLEYALNRGRADAVHQQLDMIVTVEDMSTAFVCDEHRRIEFAAGRNIAEGATLEQTRFAPLAAAIAAARATLVGSTQLGSDRMDVLGLFPFQRAPESGELRSAHVTVLVLESNLASAKQVVRANAWIRSIELSVGLAALCLMFWAFLARTVTNRIDRLVTATRRVAAGDLDARSGLTGSDELTMLSRSFDEMARQLRQRSSEQQRVQKALEDEICVRRSSEAKNDALEAELRHAQKMQAIGTLAGGIAHDFNNLLAAVLGATELALLRGDEPEQVRRCLLDVQAAGLRGRDLVRQIMAFSQKSAPKRARVSPRAVIEEVLRLVRARVPEQVELRAELDPQAGEVEADESQLHQVVMNLVSNAIDACAMRATSIVVSLGRGADPGSVQRRPELGRGEWVRISVRDDGPGMDAATLQRIFEPFFTTKGPGRGTGLGLAVVHGIVVAHKGAVLVESTQGQGSRFDVFLPRLSDATHAAVASVAASPAAVVSAPQAHVAVVDDDALVGRTTGALLRRAGLQASIFSDAKSLLVEVEREPTRFSVVITDLMMPGMSGIELAERLTEQKPRLPVVCMTGNVELAERLRADGGNGCKQLVLVKPFTQRELISIVREALQREAADAELRAS